MKIRKAALVRGEKLTFRDACTSDAEFIVDLRTDTTISRYLSQTPEGVERQREWLENYHRSEGEAYFIIEHATERIGTVRLLDARGASFGWGSWILKDGGPKNAVLESMLMVFSYAIDELGFKSSHFEVRKANTRLCRFYERFDAIRTGESDDNYFYRIDAEAIQAMREKLSLHLPSRVLVSRE